MQVSYDEGVANHIDPQSHARVVVRLQAKRWKGSGQAKLLSRESDLISSADVFSVAEGNTDGTPTRVSVRPCDRRATAKTGLCHFPRVTPSKSVVPKH